MPTHAPSQPETSATVTPSAPPGDGHYDRKYFGKRMARLASYRWQANYVVRSGARRVLLVGKGDGIVESILARCAIEVVTMDIQADLMPDVVGSVEQIPIEDASFDAAICCQVLEHLPFDQFGTCLRELRRVSRSGLVLSLPDIRPFLALGFDLYNTGRRLQMSFPCVPARAIPSDRKVKMGHHWEIGYRGTPLGRVKREIRASGWRLLECRRVPELPWHTFFHCAPA